MASNPARRQKSRWKTVLPIAAIILFALAGNVRADYQHDQDVDKAAQKLSDTEAAQRADEKARYDAQHPDDNYSPMSIILGLGVIFGGGFVVIRFFWNANQPSR